VKITLLEHDFLTLSGFVLDIGCNMIEVGGTFS